MRRKNARAKYFGIIGDQNPIEHQGGIVYDQGYGPHLLYFQPVEGDVYVHDIPIAEDVFDDLSWANAKGTASFIGMSVDELKAHGKSDNVLARASAVEAIGSYHGFGELDPEPQQMTLRQAEKKYGRMVDVAYRAKGKLPSKRASNQPDEDDDDDEREGDLRWANMATRLKNA